MNFLNKKPLFFAVIAAVFLGILLIVFREFAFNPDTLMLNSDQLNGIGSRILRAENAVLTEWDDSRLGGVPTIDALFADAYHPLVWVQFLTDPARAVGFKFILTIWVAFMSAMLLAWNLTGNRWWASLLGFLYAFSPEYFTYIYGGHDGKMMVFAIAPLALLAIRKIVRDGSLPYLMVLALSITWMILGSHLQLTYMFLWGAGFYTLYEAFFHCDALQTKGKRIGLAAAGLAFGLAISCFQVVPPYLYTTTQSVRGEGDHTNYGHAASWSLHQEEMAQMLLPGFIGVDVYKYDDKAGKLEGSSFVDFTVQEYQSSGGSPFYWGHNPFKLDHNNAGALLTLLGFLCLFLPGKRRWAMFWGLGAVLALSYGMGVHSPLFKLWYHILPGVKNFRAPGMALFWLPLLLVMMAAPVLKAISDESSDAVKNRRALLHGAAMFVVLLVIVVIARYNWTLFIGPFGLVACLAYAIACLGIMSLDDQGKNFSVANFIDSFKAGLPGTHRAIQACVVIGFALIGMFLMSGQKLLEDSVTAPYFKPLNEIAMQLSAGKIIPGFILVLVIVAATLFTFKWKAGVVQKAGLLAAVAAVELFFIDGAFIQNVEAKEYLQPTNPIAAAVKASYKADSLNTPRVLSLSRSKALSGNIFPQYHLRNADGFHDNELASYRAFRGGQQNANYLLNINNPDAAHPFLDLMNIGFIIFDSQRGTTYMPIPTAMGEAYLYGEFTVMSDEDAIKTLQTKVAIRSPKESEVASVDSAAMDSTTASKDSTAADSSVTATEKNVAGPAAESEDDPNVFYYKEKAILSENPENPLEGGIVQGHARLVEQPKMDTQVFEVESDRPAIMVVAGNYHPYWKAYVNGKESKVYKAFGNLRAVEIPKGKSTVRMEYRSKPFHACLKVSALAIVLLAFFGVAVLAKKKKQVRYFSGEGSMETVFKALLPLFIGVALISCAGTDSSTQTKVDEKSNLFKAGTPFADSLVSKTPEFAHSVFKGVIDSVPGEYYYHTTDGKIDTLFKKESGQHKPIVSIAYDSPNEQNSYELKKGSCSYIVKDGTLETELDFPKYLKKYWDNGKLKKVLTGNLYVDDQGNIALSSGREEKYFKSGKIQWQDDWRDKQVVAGKEWNENGVLVAELDFPKYLKKYWDNGKTKEISTGLLYINDQGALRLDSGHAEFYFENGKINEQSDLKNKQAIGIKVWNEDGVLIKEIDFPKSAKEYWNNGKPKGIMTGLLYRDNQGNTGLDSGHSESYFENGQVHQQNDWKDKKLLAQKEWNENGVLIKELDFPNYSKEYWNNGGKKVIATGTLYRTDKGIIKVDSGHGEVYFENGKIYQQNDWKDKQSIASKEWNENGVLVTELEFPKYIKQYWDDGKPKIIAAGFLYRDKQGIIKVDSGYSELYFENGKIKEKNNWKDKQVIACKRWNERGYLIKENAFPKYVREYWENGKPKAVLTGILYRDDQGDFRIDSGNSETYFENGQVHQQNDWKDKKLLAQKEWNEKGSLIKEIDFPKYAKEYYDNGKLKKEMTGLYRESPTNLESENGYKKEYYENGKTKEHINYKDKEPYSSKQWNEDGALSTEWDISAGYYKYYENGTLRLEAKGFKGFTGEKGVLVENGYQTLYFNNGKPQVQEQIKDKKTTSKKIWDENGTLIIEKDILKGFYKAYFPSGKISRDISGKFHYENKKIIFEDCSVKSWYENGQTEILLKYKDKKLISKKYWYENGNIAFSAELPNHYKVFYEDGKIKADVTGTLVEENGDFKIKDGVYNEYDQNGEVTASTTYKDFQIISEKK